MREAPASPMPEFNQEQPIIQPQKVESDAMGHEEFAKVLGSLATEAGKEGMKIEKDQSQAMYINSVADGEHVKTQAQMQMIEHPNLAPEIAKKTNETLQTINENAVVSNTDRARLKYYTQKQSDAIDLEAVKVNAQQTILKTQQQFYQSYPDKINAYHQALMSDPKLADQQHQAMLTEIDGMVSMGAMTPYQASNVVKDMQTAVNTAHQWHVMAQSANATAKDYHTANAHPFNKHPGDPTSPIEQNTQWLIDYHSADMSERGMLADIRDNKIPPWEAYDRASPEVRQHVMLAFIGKQQANGLINSGQPLPQLEAIYKDLSNKKNLTYAEDMQKNTLGNYLDEMRRGNMLSANKDNPVVNKIMSNFTSQNAAISSNNTLTPQDKYTALIKNKNDMINKLKSWRDGVHMSAQYFQPIPEADRVAAQNVFDDHNQDPALLLRLNSTYDKDNQVYLAQSMRTPQQRIALQAVSLAGNNVSEQEKLDFLRANQEGDRSIDANGNLLKTPGVERPKGAPTDSALTAKIYTVLAPQLNLLGYNSDPSQAKPLQDAMMRSTLNYVKLLANKAGDYALNNADKYIKQASLMMQAAYPVKSGNNWMVNTKDLPEPLTDGQLDSLAAWANNQGRMNVASQLTPKAYRFWDNQSTLRMAILPNHEIISTNANGDILFKVPYTHNLLVMAEKYHKDQQVSAESKSLIEGGAAPNFFAKAGAFKEANNANP